MSTALDNKTKDYSIRRRLLVGMVAGFFFLLSIISAGLFAYARNAANQTYDLPMAGAALSVLERLISTPDGISVDIPSSALEIIGFAKDDRVFYRVFTDQNQTLTGRSDLPLPASFEAKTITNNISALGFNAFSAESASGDGDLPSFYDADYSGESTRFLVQSRLMPSSTVPVLVTVQLGQTRMARDRLRNDLIIKGMAGLLSISLLGLFFVWIAIGRALLPLSGIVTDMSQREPTDLSPLNTSPPREIVSLIDSINDFMRRLDISKENAQSFIADVAHQMRTALSALQGQLEMVNEQHDYDRMTLRLIRAEQQCERTIRLMNQLLSHAMIIHRAEDPPQHVVVMLDIIRSVMETVMRTKGSKGIEFQLHREGIKKDQANIMGDSIAIREAITNLVDNAIKYGPPDNRIDITISHKFKSVFSDAEVTLMIDDSGPGIPTENHDKVFERFYSSGLSNSSGIGLNIVSEVAKIHQAKVSLSESPNGGLRVTIVFPQNLIVTKMTKKKEKKELSLELMSLSTSSSANKHAGQMPLKIEDKE